MVRAIGSHRHLRLRQQWRRSGSEEPVLLDHGNQNIRKPVVREAIAEVRSQIEEVRSKAFDANRACEGSLLQFDF
jgi:hypothetical protein